MNGRNATGRLFVPGLLIVLLGAGVGQSQQTQSANPAGDSSTRLADILQRAGERVKRYTDNILSIVCTESAQQQELEPDLKTSKKKPAELTYDFLILPPQPGTSSIRELRELKLVDGKAPGRNARPSFPDPTAYTTSIVVLLPTIQVNSVFSFAGTGSLDGREAFIIDYVPARQRPPDVVWKGRFFRLNFQSKGRIWIDRASYDVLRLETHLIEPFQFQSPRMTRNGPFVQFGPSHKFKVEAWDVTIRFRSETFPGMEQALLLPESAESVRVIQGSRIPRLRTTRAFTNYRRFTSEIKIEQPKETP